MNYRQIADRVLGMLQKADGNDPSNGHLTMDNWEWPTGVALYGIYKTYQQSGDRSILDYLTGWYDDMLSRPEKPHRNVNTVAPVLTLLGDTELTIDAGTQYTEPGYTATDNCDGDIKHLVNVSGNVNIWSAGTYTITYTVECFKFGQDAPNGPIKRVRVFTVNEVEEDGRNGN